MSVAATAGAIVESYYRAFNDRDVEAFLVLLTEDVAHDVNQGGREVGKTEFRAFLAHMNRCYRERIDQLTVLTETSGRRAAAEFVVHGTYIESDPDVPAGTAPARGQTYVLSAGAFFELRDDKIARVSNHYNLNDWLRQVG